MRLLRCHRPGGLRMLVEPILMAGMTALALLVA